MTQPAPAGCCRARNLRAVRPAVCVNSRKGVSEVKPVRERLFIAGPCQLGWRWSATTTSTPALGHGRRKAIYAQPIKVPSRWNLPLPWPSPPPQ
jgi:hypothetical protein